MPEQPCWQTRKLPRATRQRRSFCLWRQFLRLALGRRLVHWRGGGLFGFLGRDRRVGCGMGGCDLVLRQMLRQDRDRPDFRGRHHWAGPGVRGRCIPRRHGDLLDFWSRDHWAEPGMGDCGRRCRWIPRRVGQDGCGGRDQKRGCGHGPKRSISRSHSTVPLTALAGHPTAAWASEVRAGRAISGAAGSSDGKIAD